MFKDFELTFPDACADAIHQYYDQANLIVEYGSGGSTFVAAAKNKTVITVESSQEWLMALMASYKEKRISSETFNGKRLNGEIMPLWADIGKTEAWGYPAGEDGWKTWSKYPTLPWDFSREHKLHPDTVLIDGRFRVACFISTCVRIERPVTLIFDDFVERSQYHSVTNIVQPREIIGDRMAIFDLQPNMVDATYMLDNLTYFNDPR